jgi:hypothetical protein
VKFYGEKKLDVENLVTGSHYMVTSIYSFQPLLGALSEMVFTVLFLKILCWIYEVVIHSRVFILDLPANIAF